MTCRFSFLAICLALSVSVACGGDDRRPAGRDGGTGGGDAAPDVAFPLDAGPRVDVGPIRDSGPALPAVVWAHSGRELFRFDPLTNRVTSVGILNTTEDDVGDFFSMTDVAVRSDGALFGLGRGRVWRIDTETARCTTVVMEVQGTAMSFVPAGEIGDQEELIVGYEDSNDRAKLARVDLVAGTVVDLATFSGDCETSGDIASISGLGTFITLRCANDESQDFLATIDVMTATISIIGPTGVRGIWGLGFWAGVFYGFTNSGELVEIDASTGASTIIANELGAEDGFWGAGVTTEAPLI
ncbi:MAG: hypothetical protein ACI9KE_000785 [Polyangiales bacterium]|jgi:hypothetical protein